jgi:hypothetical protein
MLAAPNSTTTNTIPGQRGRPAIMFCMISHGVRRIALGSRVRSITVQFKSARVELCQTSLLAEREDTTKMQ